LTATPDLGSDFVQWSGDATGTNTTVNITMDSNKTVNAEFWAGPKQECLVGWYKFNEGSGSTVINYAPDSSGKLPNLTVYNVSGAFWSVPGFGYTANYPSRINHKEFAYAQLSSTKTFGGDFYGGATYAIFYKRNSLATNTFGTIVSLYEINNDDPLHGTEYAVRQAEPWNNFLVGLGWLGHEWDTDWILPKEHWMFLFYSASGFYYYFKVAKDDGTLISSPYGIDGRGYINLNWIHVGVRHHYAGDGSYGAMGTFGDLVIYNGCTLTQSEWGQWYDHLRTRYGMPARTW
jgi:hypothetical protein